MRHPASRRRFPAGVAFVLGLAATAAVCAQTLPATPLRPVTQDYFGTPVVDNYRYLEDLSDPEVKSWMKAQADYARARFDAIPGRQALLERIHSLLNSDLRRGGIVRRGERLFYQVIEPGAQVPKLYYRDGLKGEEHLLVDPGGMAKGSGTHYALDYYEPSWDGKRLAYGLSAGGSEASTLHVMDVASGKVLSEAIDRTSDASVSWRPDNQSFFYLRFNKPTPGMPANETQYNGRTYLHKVGANADGDADAVVFGRGVSPGLDVPDGQGTYVVVSPGSAYAVAVANHNMDDNPSTVYVAPLAAVAGADTPWKKVADVADGVTQFHLHGGTLFLLSQKGAPRFRLLSLPLDNPDLAKAAVVIPQGKGVLTDVQLAQDGLYARTRDGAVSHMHRVTYDGGQDLVLPTPFEGNVAGAVTDPGRPGALFGIRGWLQSTHILAYDPASGRTQDTGLNPPASLDTSGFESEEVFATSYDGTRIPLSLIHRKGLVRDGSHPTILDGYGSYGVSLEPGLNPTLIAWLERGGIYAVAHVRGGGEYGEDWHMGAYKRTKINTILDFIACGRHLVEQKYTTPQRLAGEGASAGGITVGGAMTWAPDLFGVIFDLVGMSDNLRAETEPNGPPNVSEFGTFSREEGDFHGLYAMSAYRHVRDGVSYPAVVFATGVNDPRVAPWHMMKMAARVQAANPHGKPALLRIDFDAGHGMGSSNAQREAQLADLWSFALWQMGDPAFQPK